MKQNCKICGIPTQEDFCQTCLDFLALKYPNKKTREQILQWHKTYTKKLNKD